VLPSLPPAARRPSLLHPAPPCPLRPSPSSPLPPTTLLRPPVLLNLPNGGGKQWVAGQGDNGLPGGCRVSCPTDPCHVLPGGSTFGSGSVEGGISHSDGAGVLFTIPTKCACVSCTGSGCEGYYWKVRGGNGLTLPAACLPRKGRQGRGGTAPGAPPRARPPKPLRASRPRAAPAGPETRCLNIRRPAALPPRRSAAPPPAAQERARLPHPQHPAQHRRGLPEHCLLLQAVPRQH
jgi:hypothetical protein